jgi:NAD(P)-dependent dehydrogenase (short-subunit alcohol dehydrogenase family)
MKTAPTPPDILKECYTLVVFADDLRNRVYSGPGDTGMPVKVARVALVTGGAQRIGGAIVTALASAGYAVAIHAHRSMAAAQELCGAIIAQGGRATVLPTDLSDHAAVSTLVTRAAAAIGPLTLLVNNAGEFEPDAIGNLDRALFDRQVAINLRAPLFLAEKFAAQVPAGADAAIVNLVDQRVYKLTPQFVSYTLSKSALHTATTTLAQALAPRIRVNAVAPGPTLPSPRQDADAFARQAATLPLGHGPTPKDVADAVVYLAGAVNVTGVTIAVDGGQHVAWETPDSVGITE